MTQSYSGRSLTLTGFPECGAAELFAALERHPRIDMLRSTMGAMELTWPGIVELERALPSNAPRFMGHLFSSYAYSRKAQDYLAENPRRRYVVCVRDPVKVLMSWRKMHREIAVSGLNPNHFAYEERSFYAECSVEDYYERFARVRINYDERLADLIERVGAPRLVVVSQERMAAGLDEVADAVVAFVETEGFKLERSSQDPLLGFDDPIPDEIGKPLKTELQGLRDGLRAIVQRPDVVAAV